MRASVGGFAAIALAVAACVASSVPKASPRPIELPPYVPGPNAGCAGAEPEVTVRLDPNAEPPAWFEFEGRRLDVLWPSGYRLITEPLVIIDDRGAAILRDGERREVTICATTDDEVIIFAGTP